MTTAPASTARSGTGRLWATLLVATVAAAVVNALIIVIGGAAGVSFDVPVFGSETERQVVSVGVIIGASVIWLLVGTVLAGVTVPRWPGARRVWQIIGGALAVLSLVQLPIVDADTGTKVLLGLTHLVLGVFYVGALEYWARES